MDKGFVRQRLCQLFTRLKTITYVTKLETDPAQARMFKSDRGGNQRFIGDFCAMDLARRGAADPA